MDLAEVKIYRMTHIDNMPHILQNGITHRNSINHNPNFTAIGDISLISTRDNKKVIVDNGVDTTTESVTQFKYVPGNHVYVSAPCEYKVSGVP